MVIQLLIWLDQGLNVLTGGYADEVLSARLYRNRHRSWWWAFWHAAVNLLFFWQDEHCRQSYLSEMARRHMPRSYRYPHP